MTSSSNPSVSETSKPLNDSVIRIYWRDRKRAQRLRDKEKMKTQLMSEES